jgi:hypothetical protein
MSDRSAHDQVAIIKGFKSLEPVENTKVMSPFKDQNRNQSSGPHQSRSYALWYYERYKNGRLYSCLTPLAWALIVVPTVLATLYVYNTMTPAPKPRVTIQPRDTSAAMPSGNLIKRAPPGPTPPRVRARTNINSGNSAASPQPSKNGNEQ